MKATYIDYSETNSFSPAVISYINQDPKLTPFIAYPPTIEGFRRLLENRKVNVHRETLVKVLREQYSLFSANDFASNSEEHIAADTETQVSKPEVNTAVQKNIDLLAESNTYTITTGHQLNLFTGPLYFIFKIVTAIKLADDLKKQFPDKNFVPVYWMATEDHDFEEINHTNIGGKKINWNRESKGATGRLSTADIASTVKEYINILGISPGAEKLTDLVESAYLSNSTLALATRQLVNSLFGEYGLVIIDADNAELKKQFIPVIEKDIIGQNSFNTINRSSAALKELGIDSQVNPREINFFYLRDNLRKRLVFENNNYQVLDTEISFTEEELIREIRNNPQRFSPNVVMRPLYQEIILPNIAYVGGGAEIVYWLQLKQNFDHYGVQFPILILRNSALIASHSLDSALGKLNLSIKDIFKGEEELKKEWVLHHSQHVLNLTDEWQELKCIFEKIKLRAYKIDPTLAPSTEAVKVRLQKAISNLEGKLVKAEKRNYAEALSRISNLKNKLFPKGGLQERSENFGLFYVKYGSGFIKSLMENFKPLDFKFSILQEESQNKNHS